MVTGPTDTTDLALVLSGGGARAAYQAGVVCAMAERAPELSVPILTGVSAGAINTISLASHPGSFSESAKALRDEWSRLTIDQVYRVQMQGVWRPALRWLGRRLFRREHDTVVRGLFDMSPLCEFLSDQRDLANIEAKIRRGEVRAVALSATCYGSGETITFVQGIDDLPMWQRSQRKAVRQTLTWDHVLASSAIPLVFPAVQLGPAHYGDGSVRQAAPLAPAIHLGARRILAIGMRPVWGRRRVQRNVGEYPSAAQIIGTLFHAIFLDALDADAERLERVNRTLEGLPVGSVPDGLRPIDLLVLRPSQDLGAMARPHWNRLPPVMRSLVRSIGGRREGSADFLSYLLFDPAYTEPLMELGYEDTMVNWDEIERFLAGG